MPKPNTTRRGANLQPVTTDANPYAVAMQKLGLDWTTVDAIAEAYKNSGSDEYLVLTIVLLQRLSNLEQMKGGAPESLDNYLALLIDRFYRATHHCENAAGIFAANIDKELRERTRPQPAAARRAS